MRRVMVIGCGGSGKSTLALGLGEKLDLPVTRYVWDFPKKHRPRIVSAIEWFGAHLRLIQLFRDRDAESLLATVGMV